MTVTTNLTITHLAANQNNPDVTVNEGTDILDDAVRGTIVHNTATDADYTLSTSDGPPHEWQHAVVRITDTTSPPVLSTGRNVIVPAKSAVYVFVNDTAQTLTLKTSGGTGIAVATAKTAILRCDATNVLRITPDTTATS